MDDDDDDDDDDDEFKIRGSNRSIGCLGRYIGRPQG